VEAGTGHSSGKGACGARRTMSRLTHPQQVIHTALRLLVPLLVPLITGERHGELLHPAQQVPDTAASRVLLGSSMEGLMPAGLVVNSQRGGRMLQRAIRAEVTSLPAVMAGASVAVAVCAAAAAPAAVTAACPCCPPSSAPACGESSPLSVH